MSVRVPIPRERRLIEQLGLPELLEGIRTLDPADAAAAADVLSQLAADPRLTPKKREWTNAFALVYRKQATGVDPAATLAFLDEASICRN